MNRPLRALILPVLACGLALPAASQAATRSSTYPVITGVSPLRLAVGDTLVIRGRNFVPGAFKNMLDWLVSTGELVGKPVALLNAAPAGGEYAQNAIRETLRTMNWRVVDTACRVEPFVRRKGALDDDALAALRDAVHCLATSAGEAAGAPLTNE